MAVINGSVGRCDAALKADAAKLVSMTTFPLPCKGQLDIDRPFRMDRATFIRAVPRVLDQGVGIDMKFIPNRTLLEDTGAQPSARAVGERGGRGLFFPSHRRGGGSPG